MKAFLRGGAATGAALMLWGCPFGGGGVAPPPPGAGQATNAGVTVYVAYSVDPGHGPQWQYQFQDASDAIKTITLTTTVECRLYEPTSGITAFPATTQSSKKWAVTFTSSVKKARVTLYCDARPGGVAGATVDRDTAATPVLGGLAGPTPK